MRPEDVPRPATIWPRSDLEAKFPGTCQIGKDRINLGDRIGNAEGWGWVHWECAKTRNVRARADYEAARKAARDSDIIPGSSPIVVRPVKGRITASLPYLSHHEMDYEMMADILGARKRPLYEADEGIWYVARAHYYVLAEGLAERFGACHVREYHSSTMKCDENCRTAKLPECVCSCDGEFHRAGLGIPGWVKVGSTTLVMNTGLGDRIVEYRLTPATATAGVTIIS